MNSARNKLGGVLQSLVEHKGDSQSDEEIIIKSEPESPNRESGSGSNTPKKVGGRPGGKKRRKMVDIPLPDLSQYHHTYVMKLFDRSVDLAQFSDTTPLYPICRAWLKNEPHNRELGKFKKEISPIPFEEEETSDDTPMDTDKPKNVYSLPQLVIDPRIKAEPGFHDLRVPSPVPQPDETLDIHADIDSAPRPEQLLLDHLDRWKATRNKWREASWKNENVNIYSLKIIKDIYNYHSKE